MISSHWPSASNCLLTTDASPRDRFEYAVTRAASEVVHHLEAGLRVGLRTRQHTFEPAAGGRHRATLLRHLALVEPDVASERPS